jgi:RNA polymerase sigma factor (sigma-70 family)
MEDNVLDTEQVIKEAELLVESPSGETALDAYFSILGNCPKIDQRQQVRLAADYHSEVQKCQEILNKIPGRVVNLLKVLDDVGCGERLENFVVSDREIRKREFFEGLQRAAALKNPDLAQWRIRPTLLLTWSRELIEKFHDLPQRPEVFKVTPTNQQAAEALLLWVAGADKLEKLALLAINELSFYRRELQRHAEKAEEIFCKLIEANLKLVVAMARRYRNRGLDMDDLIQEGNLGLMKGIERYQADKGFNVSTYVVWWIRQSITKALMTQGYVIRYPTSVHELLRKAHRLIEEARTEGKPEPTVHEMAKKLGTSPENVDAARRMFQVVSLNQTTGEGDETLENVIPGAEGITFREGEEVREAIEILMQCLNPSEQRVLNLRFGLSNGIAAAVDEIGLRLNVSRERVRQIQAKALFKLRKNRRVQANKVRFC